MTSTYSAAMVRGDWLPDLPILSKRKPWFEELRTEHVRRAAEWQRRSAAVAAIRSRVRAEDETRRRAAVRAHRTGEVLPARPADLDELREAEMTVAGEECVAAARALAACVEETLRVLAARRSELSRMRNVAPMGPQAAEAARVGALLAQITPAWNVEQAVRAWLAAEIAAAQVLGLGAAA